MLVAVQLRLKLTQGKSLGSDYQAHSLKLYLILALTLALVQSANAVWMRFRHTSGALSPYRQFSVLFFSQVLFLGPAVFFSPDLSQLQLAYFEIAGVLLGLGVVVWPGHLRKVRQADTFVSDLKRLWDNRSLLGLWLNYNIRSRYSQTVLGILWIVLLPLSTSAVLTIAFTQFLRIKTDVPFIVFFMAALVPYGVFTQGVQNSTRTILGMMGLLNQVYFPREVLVLVTLGEALVDLFFTSLAMLAVNALYGFWPNTLFIFLPVILAILVMFTLGLMLFVSCLSVLIRDVPQLVSVVLQLAFYLTPILYPMDDFPVRYRTLILINPLASVIQAFREIIVYHRDPDPVMLYYPAVMAVALLYTGYAFFKSNEDRFADLI
jgi:lipopolysaccharide transport system permease protein